MSCEVLFRVNFADYISVLLLIRILDEGLWCFIKIYLFIYIFSFPENFIQGSKNFSVQQSQPDVMSLSCVVSYMLYVTLRTIWNLISVPTLILITWNLILITLTYSNTCTCSLPPTLHKCNLIPIWIYQKSDLGCQSK